MCSGIQQRCGHGLGVVVLLVLVMASAFPARAEKADVALPVSGVSEPSQSVAATPPDKNGETRTKPAQLDTSTAIVNMVVGLGGIVLLILLISWGLKRFGNLSVSGGGVLKMSATIAVGTRERIGLVEVGEKKILVGITPTHISALHVFDRDEIPDTGSATGELAKSFQAMLTKAGGGKS